MIDTLKTKLVTDATHWWQMWTIRLHVLAMMIIGFVIENPTALKDFIGNLPPEMQKLVPSLVWVGWAVLVPMVRLYKQKGKCDVQPKA